MTRRITRGEFTRYAAFLAALLVAALTGALTAQAASGTPHSAIYSSENPIPAIAERVRPAVVQVINVVQSWSQRDGAMSEDQPSVPASILTSGATSSPTTTWWRAPTSSTSSCWGASASRRRW
jgi:hypothetical protein